MTMKLALCFLALCAVAAASYQEDAFLDALFEKILANPENRRTFERYNVTNELYSHSSCWDDTVRQEIVETITTLRQRYLANVSEIDAIAEDVMAYYLPHLVTQVGQCYNFDLKNGTDMNNFYEATAEEFDKNETLAFWCINYDAELRLLTSGEIPTNESCVAMVLTQFDAQRYALVAILALNLTTPAQAIGDLVFDVEHDIILRLQQCLIGANDKKFVNASSKYTKTHRAEAFKLADQAREFMSIIESSSNTTCANSVYADFEVMQKKCEEDYANGILLIDEIIKKSIEIYMPALISEAKACNDDDKSFLKSLMNY